MSSTNQHNLEAFGDAGMHPIWYHGAINRGNVENILRGKPEGAFMIRDSGSSPGDYVLSVCEGTRISHYIIQKRGAHAYVLSDQTFVNLVELFNFYRIHLLDSTCLTVPVPEKEALRNGNRIRHFLITVRAKFNFNGRDEEDLSFHKGELLNIVEKHEPQWWRAQSHETLQIGVIPANYVEWVEDGPVVIAEKEVAAAAEERKRIQNKPLPPPPVDHEAIRRKQEAEAAKLAQRKAAQERKKEAQRKADEAARARALEVKRLTEEHERKEQDRLLREKGEFERKQAEERAKAEAEFQEAERKRLTRVKAAFGRPSFVIGKALLDRSANAYDRSGLTFRESDNIHIKKQHPNGLWVGSVISGRRKGRRGHFPFTFVEILERDEYDEDVLKIEKEFKIAELKKAGVDIESLLRPGKKKELEQKVFQFERSKGPELPPEVQVPVETEDMYADGSDNDEQEVYEETDPSNAQGPPVVPRGNGNRGPAPPVPQPRDAPPPVSRSRKPPPALPTQQPDLDDIYGEVDEDDVYGETAELFDDQLLEEAMEDIYGSL